MMIRALLFSLAMAGTAMLAAGDCIARAIGEAPPTRYEAEEMSPQNMDFDKANNMFIAHSGWYNNKLIHYYKFIIYAPSTYKGVISPPPNADDVPTQKIYFVTTDGTLNGAVGKPIIQYHHADKTLYSDFMEVVYVAAPAGYVADTFKSEEDIAGQVMDESGIMLNIPVVPTGSTMQHPHKKGTEKAPIAPVPVWYKCTEVWTYVFEVTDQAAADHFASTRTEDPEDFAFKIPVVNFATSTRVRAIPLWHLNQYSRGVTAGVNGGGPSPAGMKNVINLDRADPGYSPLWAINWMTALPVNYLADEVSSASDMTTENGFDMVSTPMFVNCPDIGDVGTEENPVMTTEHETSIDITNDSNWILGGDMSLIFKAEVPVSFQTSDGTEIASTKTNMMGAYEYELMSSDIPMGTTEVIIVANDNTIRTLAVVGGDETSGAESMSTISAVIGATLACIAAAVCM